jgi:hypothetical protein
LDRQIPTELRHVETKDGHCAHSSFPDWNKEFSVHVDVSSISLVVVLEQLGEWEIDHLLVFSSRKLSTAEINYTIAKREGLAMVYALQKFCHYFLRL